MSKKEIDDYLKYFPACDYEKAVLAIVYNALVASAFKRKDACVLINMSRAKFGRMVRKLKDMGYEIPCTGKVKKLDLSMNQGMDRRFVSYEWSNKNRF